MNNLRNSVRLTGFLGNDPEVKVLANNRKLVRMSIATDESYKNEKGEKVKETQWHYVNVWGKTADIAEKYLHKGSEVSIEGRLSNRSYVDKDGVKRYTTEIVVNDLLLLGKKSA